MYLDAILEVAIGLVFSWLVLSIATMQLQEWISSFFGWRAELLEGSLKQMLQNDEWVEKFYSHPVIDSLSRPGRKPSYIPPDRFAQSLFDVMFNTPVESWPKAKESRFQLQDIKGIGPESTARLNKAGIFSIADLAKLSPDELRAVINPDYEHILDEENILKQAEEFLKRNDE